MQICIVIPSFNLADKLFRCLKAIERTGYHDLSIIIVDNASEPPLKSKLFYFSGKFSNIYFLRNKTNLGFTPSMNLGLRYAVSNIKKTDYFLLLNNDAYINKNFFVESIRYIKKIKPDLMSPLIYLTNNRGIDNIGINYYSDGSATDRINNPSDRYLLNGACLFVSKEFVIQCFELFGWFFITMFESYVEDIEICLRALLMGKKLYLLPKFLLYHDKSSSIIKEKALYFGARNQLWTIITTWTSKMIIKNLGEIVKGQLINNFIYALKFNYLFILRVYFETVINLPTLLKIRKKIQKARLIDLPEEVLLKNPITVSTHIKRSATYTRVKNYFCLFKRLF